MRHAILGAGGVGGLVAVALAKQGEEVTVILRPGTASGYPSELTLEGNLGTHRVAVKRAESVTEPCDVLWVAVKATQLESALKSVRVTPEEIGTVVPLLNGVDHVALLRARFGGERVVPAAIRVEAERVAPGKFLVGTMGPRLNLSACGEARLAAVIEKLRQFGIKCYFDADEKKLLWSKLVVLAPFALTTSASGFTIGEVCKSPEWRPRLNDAIREACTASTASGSATDANEIIALFDKIPGGSRSSMQKDVAAGNPPELDAIAGPVLRAAAEHGFAAPATKSLVELIQGKFSAKSHG